jgi:hypothetical protein
MVEMQAGRVCATCKIEKPWDDFYKKKNEIGGHDYHCKICIKEIRIKRRLANYEDNLIKERAQRKRWREANPERCAELKKRSKVKNSYRRFKKNQCESCGFVAIDSCQLDVDHIDGINTNNDPINLQTLCANCHRLKTKLARDGRTYLRLVNAR